MAGPTYLFLDTEWADESGTELVSLALVSEDGRHVFYAERDPLPLRPTAFVRDAVYPRLERGDVAMSDAHMTRALRRFLSGIREPYVLADYPNDLVLLRYTLAGLGLSPPQAEACGSTPTVVGTLMMRDERMTALLEAWFRAHPGEAARRHHALVDAQALRIAWQAVTERITPDWL